MNLIATEANPIPSDPLVTTIRASDGAALRVARWHPGAESRGSVVICSGRAEFIEKYFETVRDLLDRRLSVVVFDWRGQGLSARELANPRKGHIDDFSFYERDLDAVVAQALEPFCAPPFFAIGHSMGAAVLLTQARGGRSPFERLLLTAPMIDLSGLRLPKGARLLADALDIAGLGGAFIPGGSGDAPMSRPFAGNALTSDENRYRRCAEVIDMEPAVAIGAPTIGWINAAFRCMRQFADVEFPRRTLTPTLVFTAGADTIVDNRAVERFTQFLKAGRMIEIPFARHEILLEKDRFREQFWASFDAFALRGAVLA